MNQHFAFIFKFSLQGQNKGFLQFRSDELQLLFYTFSFKVKKKYKQIKRIFNNNYQILKIFNSSVLCILVQCLQ